jgi:hypothetical protein
MDSRATVFAAAAGGLAAGFALSLVLRQRSEGTMALTPSAPKGEVLRGKTVLVTVRSLSRLML